MPWHDPRVVTLTITLRSRRGQLALLLPAPSAMQPRCATAGCARRRIRAGPNGDGTSEGEKQGPLLRREPVHEVSRGPALVRPPFAIVDTSGLRGADVDIPCAEPAASAASSAAPTPAPRRERGRSPKGYFLSFLVTERRALRDMRRRADLVGRRVLPELRGIGLPGGPAQGRSSRAQALAVEASSPCASGTHSRPAPPTPVPRGQAGHDRKDGSATLRRHLLIGGPRPVAVEAAAWRCPVQRSV